MALEHITEGMGTHHIPREYTDSKRRIGPQEKKEPAAARTDRVEISEHAKRMIDGELKARATEKGPDEQNGPETRFEYVERVVEKIQESYYEQREVVERIASRLLEEGFLGRPGKSEAAEAQPQGFGSDEIRWDKVREVEEKIENGFYDRDEIIKDIVSVLLS